MTRARLAAFVAVVVAVVGSIVWSRVRSVVVPRPARWIETPLICPGPDVSPSDLDEAVAWWRQLGHDLEVDCDGPWNVSIDLDPTLDTRDSIDEGELVHGRAHVLGEGGEIDAAEILLRPGVGALAIAHELGHALGYLHPAFAPSGHLMHPSRPGWDGRGLQAP